VDLAILRARLGVAENGAMWLSEREMVHRVLPFITQHLILLVDPGTIVATMHDAYRQVDIAETGFGLFVAGPSKTADIEQSLVIGAHGPRSLTVCMENFNNLS
jgi:L-lactate dehydrogenase complex protein LldG